MTKLDNKRTAVAAKPRPTAFLTDEVTAHDGHSPNSNTSAGFSLMMPLSSSFLADIALISILKRCGNDSPCLPLDSNGRQSRDDPEF